MKQDQHESSTHLSQVTLAKLKAGRLTDVEKIEVLEHLANSSLCAALFAEHFQPEELLSVPIEFSNKVLKDIQADHEPAIIQSNRKREFYFYAARVSLAMCLTLMLLFSGTFNFIANTVEAKAMQTIDFSKVNELTDNIRNISDKIVDMEVYNNDQKKK